MECNENFAETDAVDTAVSVDGFVKPHKKPGRPKGSGNLSTLTPYDSIAAKAASEKAAVAKAARAKIRKLMLAAVIKEGLPEKLAQAVRTRDLDLLEIIERASKLTGLTFRDSDESIQQLNVKSEEDVKHSGAIRFVVETVKKEQG